MEAIGVRSTTRGGECTDCESDAVPKGRCARDEGCTKRESEHIRKRGAQLDIYRQNAVMGELRDRNWSRRLMLLLRARVRLDPVVTANQATNVQLCTRDNPSFSAEPLSRLTATFVSSR
jgi:hypothetical protein